MCSSFACGSGTWTQFLVRSAKAVTALDAAPEMLARAKARDGVASVRFIEADLFSWRPDRGYDAVFFGFWLSHVPEEHFDSFWSLVDDCLRPGGGVFFFDDRVALTTASKAGRADGSTCGCRKLNLGCDLGVRTSWWRPRGSLVRRSATAGSVG